MLSYITPSLAFHTLLTFMIQISRAAFNELHTLLVTGRLILMTVSFRSSQNKGLMLSKWDLQVELQEWVTCFQSDRPYCIRLSSYCIITSSTRDTHTSLRQLPGQYIYHIFLKNECYAIFNVFLCTCAIQFMCIFMDENKRQS